ncbi:hypothetical protein FKW77_008910 [Venturia effusa]|uniref:Piwi domain-containing protein n=1 Tax=Venturia effusa TaxID=50376 RepID=A0A517KX41_9PEZI|nr:hypothetical protein FKW77_008910 [Venturia effusa]
MRDTGTIKARTNPLPDVKGDPDAKNSGNAHPGEPSPQGRQPPAKNNTVHTAPTNLSAASQSGASSGVSHPESEDTTQSMTTNLSTLPKPDEPSQAGLKPHAPESNKAEHLEKDPVALPPFETTTVTVHASTGPVFNISVTAPVNVYSISFEKTSEASSPTKVERRSLKRKLFQQLLEESTFKEEFLSDVKEVFFDGNDKLFSSTRVPSYELNDFEVPGSDPTQPKIKYQVRIEPAAQINPDDFPPKSDEDWKNIRALAKLVCNGQNVIAEESVQGASQSEQPVSRGYSRTDKALATLKDTKTTQQLAVKAICCMSLPKTDLLALIRTSDCGISSLTLIPDWLIRNLIGLQVVRLDEGQDTDATKCRIVGIGKPARETGIDFEKLNLPDLPLVNIGSTRKPLWEPIENLRVLGEQQLFRGFLASDKKSLLNESPAGHDAISNTVQDRLNSVGLSAKLCPLTAKQFQTTPSPIYGTLPAGKPASTFQRFENDAPQVPLNFAIPVAADAKGQWKLANGGPNRTLLDLQAVHIQQVLELGSGSSMGRSKALEHSLEMYKARADRWRGADGQNLKSESLCTPIYQADVNQLHVSERVNDMFLDSQPVDVLVVLLPSASPLQFSKVKLWADCLQGIRTICALRKRGEVCLPHAEELAMKINHHAGGINYEVRTLGLDPKETMVVGISVSHPAPALVAGRNDCPSVVAVVANCDDRFQQLPGDVRYQSNGSKKIKDLEEMVRNCINRWQDADGHKPANLKEIIVYRTGISKFDYTKKDDTTKKQMWEHELSNLEAAANACAITAVSIVIILVEKNHKTKFHRPKEAGLLPGLYVEGGDKTGDNFYLQSHGVMQPKSWEPREFDITVRGGDLTADTPAQPRQPATQGPDVLHPRNAFYSVLKPPSKSTKEKLIETTYNLCWNTVHSTSALSYASPAYYADQLCERGLAYLKPLIDRRMTFKELNDTYFQLTADKKNPWHKNLEGKMFYI